MQKEIANFATRMVTAVNRRQLFHLEREQTWLWLIIVLGAALRLYQLGSQSLWEDEGLQYRVANGENFLAVLDFTRIRTWHPPLSYLVNHLFLLAGKSDFFLRFPSVLMGVGSLPLLYAIMRRVVAGHTAIFAVAVLAFSPFHVWYSQDGRMYAQMLFLSLLSTWIFLRALEDTGWRWWVFYALAVAAGMYTHVMMAFGVLANVLFLLIYHWRRLPSLIASGAIALLLFLPWVFSFPMVRGFVNDSRGPRTFAGSIQSGFSWAVLPYTFFTYSAGFSLGPSVAELHENRSLGFVLQFLPLLLPVAIVVGALLITGVWALYKHHGVESLVFCSLGVVLPLAGAVLFSLLPRGLFNVRYTILALPYFCAFVGAALALYFTKSRLVGTIAVLALSSIYVASLVNHFSNPRYAKEDIKSAVASWRLIAPGEYLLSATPSGLTDAVNRYLVESERDRHVALGLQNLTVKAQLFFAEHDVSSAYVILARDWHQAREKAIRGSFTVVDEQSYSRAKLLKILAAQPGSKVVQ